MEVCIELDKGFPGLSFVGPCGHEGGHFGVLFVS